MNRIEALKAAFEIAGPNVTAEEHIQYAEFLLGDENVVYVKDWITIEDTQSICDDPREYTPHDFIGEYVDEAFDDEYPVGTVALDDDRDVYYKESDGSWTAYGFLFGQDWYPGIKVDSIANSYDAVVVA